MVNLTTCTIPVERGISFFCSIQGVLRIAVYTRALVWLLSFPFLVPFSVSLFPGKWICGHGRPHSKSSSLIFCFWTSYPVALIAYELPPRYPTMPALIWVGHGRILFDKSRVLAFCFASLLFLFGRRTLSFTHCYPLSVDLHNASGEKYVV
ncbi:hypothetical protein B0J18DRAFT_143552 [Chaetomium sp. MPI-SDFR-AT-0129]|nr:hypothetical protein B0J18DRAFT_143552 [Chaetomium sp. MPI-SDFR-AT-0129]